MRLQLYQEAVYILIFVFLVGCSSHITNVTSSAGVRYQRSPDYVIYYSDGTGIFESNTTTIDKLIFRYPSNTRGFQWEVSPDSKKIAFSLVDNDFEETTLSILDLISLKSWQIKKIPKGLHFSFKWSPDSKELAVAYASFTDNKYRLEYRSGVADIFITSSVDSTVKSIGCNVSKSVNHWLTNNILVVGDGNFLYGVNRQNCSTLFSLNMIDKTKITFSPDGTMIFYFTNVPVYKESGGKIDMTELYLANYDGKQPKKIIGYRYDPHHASWSPDGTKIVCDVRSLEWTDVRHIAIYDLVAGKASFSTEENDWGIPISEKPFWSPDGTKLLYDQTYELLYGRSAYETFYDNTYQTGSNSYFVLHKTLRNLLTNQKEVILEGSIHQNNLLTQAVGETVFWIDKQNILFGSAQWYKIYNILTKSVYTFSPDKHPILIKQLSK